MAASITQVLLDTRAALDEEIAATQAEITELTAKLRESTLQRQGIDAAIERFGDTSTTTPATLGPAVAEEVFSSNGQPKEPGEPTDNSALNSRVLDLLLNAEQPVHIGEIATMLGLDVTQARSAVAYLNRRSKVRNVRRGFWTSAAPTDTDAAPADTETASGPIPSIMEGGGASGTGLDGDHGEFSSRQAEHRDHGHGAPVGG